MTAASRRITGTIMWLGLAGLCAAVLSLTGTYLYLDPQVPPAETYRNVQLETPLRIYAADGELIAEFGERRLIPIKFDEIPADFISALLDTEDKRFYEHGGIDYISLANDSIQLLLTQEKKSGASTITMQLARNISFSLEQTFIRKFKEMLLSLKIEQEFTKNEILELYVNAVPFGKRAYGAQAAAYTYYGKPLAELSLAQLAMLAGIPQAPSAGNPINGPDRALRRRNLVLARMLEQQSITQAQHDEASASPISAQVYARELGIAAPYAAEWVRRQLSEYEDLYTGGYEVITTLNSEAQRKATDAVRAGLMEYDERHGYRGAELTVGAIDAMANIEESVESEAATDTDTALEPEATDLRSRLLALLKDRKIYGDLTPVGVFAISDNVTTVINAKGESIELPFESMAWARTYLDVNNRGKVPEQATDVVQIGDIIRIRPTEAGWRLAQIPKIQGALVSVNPQNGAVIALEGGYDFALSQFDHALQAARQPGSGFKPFVYSAALANGITPSSVYMDAPLVFKDDLLEEEYRPDNSNNSYNGPTRLREALFRSINLVSMRVLLDIGARKTLDHVGKFGFDTSNFPRNTQLAVGGGTLAVTPLEVATAYSVFANGGYEVEPYIIDQVRSLDGEILFKTNPLIVCDDCDRPELANPELADSQLADSEMTEDNANPDTPTTAQPLADSAAPEQAVDQNPELEPPPEPRHAQRMVDERNVYIMHTMLQDVVRRGTAAKAYRELQRSDIAGKTGTTNDAADTWFNGYTPEMATTVWVGFSNHQPLGNREFGSTTPLPVWMDYMGAMLAGREEQFPVQPPGIVTMKIDPETGEAARPGQRSAIFEYFLAENAPKRINRGFRPSSSEQQDEIKAVDIF